MKDAEKKKVYGRDVLEPDMNKSAIALEYNMGDTAPKVVASGRGYLADKILESAGQHEIPVYKDERLAKNLEDLEIGEYIPKELYQVVAEILVYVDAMDKIRGKVLDRTGKKR